MSRLQVESLLTTRISEIILKGTVGHTGACTSRFQLATYMERHDAALIGRLQ